MSGAPSRRGLIVEVSAVFLAGSAALSCVGTRPTPDPAWERWLPAARAGARYGPREPYALDPEGRWLVRCRRPTPGQARKIPMLYLRDRAVEPLDDFGGFDRSSRYLVGEQHGSAWLLDADTGVRIPLRPGAFVPPGADYVVDGPDPEASRTLTLRRPEGATFHVPLPSGVALFSYRRTYVLLSELAREAPGRAMPSGPATFCDSWDPVPDFIEGHRLVASYVVSARTGRMTRVDGVLQHFFGESVVVRRAPDGELVVVEPSSGDEIARVPAACGAEPVLASGEAVLVGCKRLDGEAPPLWIYDRGGGHDLHARAPDGLRSTWVGQAGDACLGDVAPGSPTVCVDVAERRAFEPPRGHPGEDFWLLPDRRVLVREGGALWLSHGLGLGRERRRIALPAGVDLGRIRHDLLVGEGALISLGPLVLDTDAGVLLGVAPGPHAALRRDGSMLVTAPARSWRAAFRWQERLADFVSWQPYQRLGGPEADEHRER